MAVIGLCVVCGRAAADEPIAGSVSNNLLSHGAASYSELYAAYDFLGDDLFQAASHKPGKVVAAISTALLPGVLQVPADLTQTCANTPLDSCPFGVLLGDAVLSRGGVAWQGTYVGVFYAGGFVGTRLASNGWYPAASLGDMGLGAINVPLAPLVAGFTKIPRFTALQAGFNGSGAQYILGVSSQLAGIDLRLGYSGGDADHGVYMGFSHGDSGLRGALVWRPGEMDVPVLDVGLRGSPVPGRWIVDAQEARLLPSDLLTSLYLRHTTVGVPHADGLTGEGGLWALYLEETNIPTSLGSFDITFSMGVAPAPFLQGLLLGWHTDTLHAPPDAPTWDVGGWIGLVGVPDLLFYGVHGGARFAWGVEARYGRWVAVQLAQNPLDALTVLPFSQGGWSLTVRVDREAFWHD